MPLATEQELAHLRIAHQAALKLSTLLEVPPLLRELVTLLLESVPCQRAIVLLIDKYSAALEHGEHQPPLPDRAKQSMLEMVFINTFNAGRDAAIQVLHQRQPRALSAAELATTRLEVIGRLTEAHSLHLFPLVVHTDTLGMLLIQPHTHQVLDVHQVALVMMLLAVAAPCLYNARHHSQTVQELSNTVYEMNILQQIDAELNDTIELSHVFRIIMDWALRFTNADVASLALYDEQHDRLTITAQYGYDAAVIHIGVPASPEGGIQQRVARAGKAEIIPDVSLDKNYTELAAGIRAHMSIPILREEKVIAVLSLESRKLNGFTDNHLSFVSSLARRAGVAVDNARLFTETRREREKLALILRNIADIVFVLDNEQRVVLFNHAAAAALRLADDADLIGRRLAEIITDASLKERITALMHEETDGTRTEILLPNSRTYYALTTHQRSIGWIIVMQDITQFKEAEKVKNELMATVSHDLKQPLSVMRGYLDLLQMTNDFDERSRRYMDNLDYAFHTMRQLIDDLLDMARIEAGVELKIEPLNLRLLILSCIELLGQQARNKSQTLQLDIPEDVPPLYADLSRLRQIFTNLIGNAIKYTPPNGTIRIYLKESDEFVTVCVQDNGIGISPEDQAHIFDRFYRVRSPETERIEGTGLGLAIVRSLVEAHHGQITVTSQAGKGSTFHVVLPTRQDEKQTTAP